MAVLFGIPQCAGGSGEELAQSIVDAAEPFVKPSQVLDLGYIVWFQCFSCQVPAFTGDGVYFHCKVPDKLEEKMQKKLFRSHDFMHRGALVDKELRSGKRTWSEKFKWLVDMTINIGKLVTLTAWGKTWADFVKVCEQLRDDPDSEEFSMLRPSSFSETKMADHAHDVYHKARHNYRALVLLCEELKMAGVGGSADQKKKAQNADQIQGDMFNWSFALSLSMVTDVYKLYRLVSCCLQKIDVLPHEKYDSFKEFVGVLLKMKETVKVSDCPCNEVDMEEKDWQQLIEKDKNFCLWPRFHRDVKIGVKSGKFQGQEMGMVRAEERLTRRAADVNFQWLNVDIGGVVSKVEERAVNLVDFVGKGLEKKVYTEKEVEEVEHTRILLDLRGQALKVRDIGHVTASGFLQFKQWYAAASFFEPDLHLRLHPDELRLQFGTLNQVTFRHWYLDEKNHRDNLTGPG